MKGKDRIQSIKEILYKKKRIDVSELSAILDVSEVTVRRDLDKLEDEGFLIKAYGGAVINKEFDMDDENQNDEYIEYKEHIGRIAAQLINENEPVFLGSGSTCLQIAKKIKDRKKLIIVTNDLNVANELRDNPSIKTILTGGETDYERGLLYGEFAIQMIKNIFIGKAFISLAGIDFKYGYSAYTYEETLIYRTIREIARECFVVADYSKFGKASLAKVFDIHDIGAVITNKQAPDEYKNFFFENSISLYTSFSTND